MYLIDTNVISELTRKSPDSGVTQFLATRDDLALSVITLHELEYGRVTAPADKQPRLDDFMSIIQARFGASILPIDTAIGETAARQRGSRAAFGKPLLLADSLIAATATVHGFTLVTRNTKDFEQLQIQLYNPFMQTKH